MLKMLIQLAQVELESWQSKDNIFKCDVHQSHHATVMIMLLLRGLFILCCSNFLPSVVQMDDIKQFVS